ncbi:MAG: 3-dehydroquinate synthase [Chloroflexi bacterium]|nr:3-dehydroquinate synthase [Chloroflexota bacterium]
MHEIFIEADGIRHPVLTGEGLLAKTGEMLAMLGLLSPVMVVTNSTVGPLYARAVIDAVRSAGFECSKIEIPDGEKFKSIKTAELLYDRFLEEGLNRSGTVVALGGGVVTDIAGFCAATYMRGVPLVLMPTTLLSQVDAAIGGKTAVNHPDAKNIIGCFYFSELVICDHGTLGTLSPEERRCGLSEIIKAACISSPDLLSMLENSNLEDAGGPENMDQIILQAVSIKADFVRRDPYEKTGVRALLNFGHTIGHALEKAFDYDGLKHGEAVALGMLAAAKISVSSNHLAPEFPARLEKLLKRSGLPTEIPDVNMDDVISAMSHDKKKSGKLKFVYLSGPGQALLSDAPPADVIIKALEEMRSKQ